MTQSIGMAVYDFFMEYPDSTLEELEAKIRNDWAYGQEEAVEYLRTNYKWLLKELAKNQKTK